MSIHIELVDRHGTAPYKGEDKIIILTDVILETVEEALNWWNVLQEMTNLQDENVEEVIKATADEYVGTEHELMNSNGEYTSWILCIEGQIDKKTFDQRLPDLFVEEVIYMGDNQYQLNGTTGSGRFAKKTWMTVHLVKGCEWHISKVIDLED